MTETKFTPVPWIVLDQTIMSDQEYEDLYNCQNHARLETIWNGKEIIAEVCAWDDRITEKSLSANAHLIAAAPDMYEELECARDVFRFYQSHHEFKGGTEKAIRNKKIADRIDRLLAKARGEA